MGNRYIKNTVSIVTIIAMVITMAGGITALNTSTVLAETQVTADKANNTLIVPDTLKRGSWFNISIIGDRYSDVVEKYDSIYNLGTQKTIFEQDEEFYEPVTTQLKSVKVDGAKLNNTYTYSHDQIKLFRHNYGLSLKLNAGKYTVTTKFIKRTVDISSLSTVPKFISFDTDTNFVSNTFYVDSKVKFAYNKKYGTLKKSNRTKYLSPGKKYGKLPKPKAKKGYKFTGWYTKATKGKKVKASTKVPTKNDIILYARYKKK